MYPQCINDMSDEINTYYEDNGYNQEILSDHNNNRSNIESKDENSQTIIINKTEISYHSIFVYVYKIIIYYK